MTEKEIEHLAKLARLGVSGEEKTKLREDVDRILEYVGELAKLDAKNVEPLSGGTDLFNVLREDVAPRKESLKDSLLAAAPEKEGDYFKVPRILG